jgi:hypothetical protein
VYDGSNKEIFFEMNFKFKVVCEMLELTTGDELFDNFYHCLDGTALIEFKQAADGKPRTVAGFQQALEAFKMTFMLPDAQATQIAFMDSKDFKKLHTWEVDFFAQCVETMLLYTQYMPGEDEITETRKTTILFKTFPEAWHINFIHSGYKLQVCTLHDLQAYMANERVFADCNKKKGGNNNNNKNNNNQKQNSDGNRNKHKGQNNNNWNNKWQCSDNNNPNYNNNNWNNNNQSGGCSGCGGHGGGRDGGCGSGYHPYGGQGGGCQGPTHQHNNQYQNQ